MTLSAAIRTQAHPRTRWAYVGLLLASGMGAAMQIGKVPPSLAILQRELHLGLVAAAWVISLFSIVGALTGSLAGTVADRVGPRRAAVLGLACMAAASFWGAHAGAAPTLLASRALEGMGFVIVVVAVPSLLFAASAEHDRHFVPALWGTYVPAGMALALVTAPAIVRLAGWRALWELNALLLLLLAVVLGSVPAPLTAARPAALQLSQLRQVLTSRGPLLLAVIFACYTFQYMAVMGFLPTLLLQQGYGAQSAGALAAAAVLANAAGNLAASALAARRVSPYRLIGFGCVAMALTVSGIYAPPTGPFVRYALVLAFSGFAGLIPASIFALVPSAAPASGSRATTMGLVVQASHAGQLVGPPAVAAVAAAAAGFQYSAAALVPAAACAFVATARLHTRSLTAAQG